MELPELSIGTLRARLPIIQGGMGIGISLSGLASAVAGAGGIGVISGVQIGFRDPMFWSDPYRANMKAIGEEIQRARSLAPGGVLGINFMYILGHCQDYVAEAVRNGIDLIISGAGLPMMLPGYVAGSKTCILPIVSSARACRLIFTNWFKKYDRVADGVVVEGPKAGGHLGFKLTDMRDGTAQPLEEIVRDVVEYVREFELRHGAKKIPVIAAGGINCHGDIVRMLELGADGVQIGTPFVATRECDASDAYKQAYVQAKEEDVRIVLSPSGLPARAVNTPFLQRVYGVEGSTIPVERCSACLPGICHPADTPYCLSQALFQAARGEGGLVFCGARVGEVGSITTVSRLMKELAGETD